MKKINGFKNSKVYVSGVGITNTSLKIENGKISEIGNSVNTNEGDYLELPKDLIVVPGFIDKHIHGANNSDSMYPHHKDILNISKIKLEEGVTSYLATTMTQSVDAITAALNNLRDYIESDELEGARVIGIHLEGPFINKVFKGSQPEEYIINPNLELFKKFESASGGNIKQVTYAFELGGEELTKYLYENKIVASIGHSEATSEDVHRASSLGVTSLTHAFNAMKPLHHREVGTIGGALLEDDIYLEVIADLVHLSPDTLRIIYKMKGKDKIILVSDAMEASHLEDDKYMLGGQEVFVKNRVARLASGALAGSTLEVNKGIANLRDVLGISLTDAIDMVTINPAKNLYLDEKIGKISKGHNADFTVIDEDLNVYMTIRDGNILFNKLKQFA